MHYSISVTKGLVSHSVLHLGFFAGSRLLCQSLSGITRHESFRHSEAHRLATTPALTYLIPMIPDAVSGAGIVQKSARAFFRGSLNSISWEKVQNGNRPEMDPSGRRQWSWPAPSPYPRVFGHRAHGTRHTAQGTRHTPCASTSPTRLSPFVRLVVCAS